MSTKTPRKASSKRKKPKQQKSPDKKQVFINSKVLSGEPEDEVDPHDRHDQGTSVYGHGSFQRLIGTFTAMALFVMLCHSQSFALVTRPVDHWCRPPPRFAALSVSQWKNVGIPVDEEGRPSECIAYVQPDQQPNDTETYECGAWDYDPTQAAQSARSFWNLVCRRSWLVSLGNAAFMSGALLVVPLAGYLADHFGRETVINTGVVVLLTSTGATCISRAFSFFLMAKFVNSACASSIFVISLILLYEVVPLNYRVLYISVSLAVGELLADVWLFIVASLPVVWSLLQVVVLSPTMLLLLSTYAVQESPVWLLAVFRVDEAQAVMFKAASMNNMNRLLARETMQRVRVEHSRSERSPCTSGVSSPVAVETRRHQIIRLLVMAFTMMLSDYSLYWTSRLRKGSTLAVVVVMMAAPSYVVMYLALISLGRLQFLLVVVALLGGSHCLCSIAIYTKPHVVGDVVLVFAQCCNRMLIPSAYLYMAELFPASERCAAFCGAYASGRLGAVAASVLSLLDDVEREDLKLAIVGSAVLLSLVAMLGLPETSRRLVEARAAQIDRDLLKVMQETLESSPSPRLLHKKEKS